MHACLNIVLYHNEYGWWWLLLGYFHLDTQQVRCYIQSHLFHKPLEISYIMELQKLFPTDYVLFYLYIFVDVNRWFGSRFVQMKHNAP